MASFATLKARCPSEGATGVRLFSGMSVRLQEDEGKVRFKG